MNLSNYFEKILRPPFTLRMSLWINDRNYNITISVFEEKRKKEKSRLSGTSIFINLLAGSILNS